MIICASCCFNLEFSLRKYRGSIPEGVTILSYDLPHSIRA